MALDGIVLNKLVNEFNSLCPIRINKIYSVGKSELLFNIRANNESNKLMISGDSNQNRFHFTHRSYTHDDEPTNFVMLLRKYLINGMITNFEQFNYDRIIRLDIENFNSIGDKVIYHLYLELMGRYANIIFTDHNNIIFDAVKRISPLDNPNNVIVPGSEYIPLYDNEKKSLFRDDNFDIHESLVSQFAGVSPLLEKEIRYRITNNNQSFKDIVSEIEDSNSLVLSSSDRKNEFHVIPLTHEYNDFKTVSFHEGFDIYYYDKSQNERIKQATNDLLRFLRKETKKLNRKLIKLNEELVFNQNSEINLKNGDLITTYQYQIKKGMPYVNLIDYDTNEEVTIPLDEKLSPIENAQKYYKLYRKQTNSLKHLKEQIETANKEIEYFNLLMNQLEFADINSAKEIRQELIDKKYLFEKKQHKKAKRKSRPDYLEINYHGTSIKVGKNNIQNDYITKNANRNDYWFHVESYHGSHVVVNTDNLTDDLIVLAATLATHFSQAKNSTNVSVNYTQIRNIKRTSTKGLVTMNSFDTVIVENDINLIKDYI